MIPDKDPLFVPFGVYEDCKPLYQTNIFYPCLLTGPSGIGKTVAIEQMCAEFERDYYRTNITYQTDEDDLIGGLRLEKGETVFNKGPVIRAMEVGGVLLLDEVDLASPMLIMCLQSILEGKGYLIKKTNEWVQAKPGFQIFATANTKGLGDTTGSFVGTQVLNEAFLERFPVTFECDYPPRKIEKKILTKLSKHYNIENTACLIESILDFATDVRTQYKAGSIENTISTRRLVHIVNAFSIWKDERTAVKHCLNRFDEHVKQAFWNIFELKFEENKRTHQDDTQDTEFLSNINLGNWDPW